MTDGRPVTVALQGELGSFSDEAVEQLWGPGAVRRPCHAFTDVTRAVSDGTAEFGVLPVENTIVGPVAASREALHDRPELIVVGETEVAVHHCLLALPGTPLARIRLVLSHPVALAQCGRFFAAHLALSLEPFYDTAGAAREVARRADHAIAAVASRRAAERYGLAVVRADLEDRPDNRTRFVAIARAARRDPTAPRAPR